MSKEKEFTAHWISVEERLPACSPSMEEVHGWVIWDGKEQSYTQQHPVYWNRGNPWDDKVVEWLEIPVRKV